MKKKFLTFILAICLIIPCTFMFVACDNKGSDNIEVRIAEQYVQWSYDGETWTNVISIEEIKELLGDTYKGDTGEQGQQGIQGPQGIAGKQVEFYASDTHIQWRYVGETTWKNLIALNELKGKDADVWTIGSDGYWYKNGVKTEYVAVNKKLCSVTYTLDVNCNFPIGDENELQVMYGESIEEMPIPTNDFGYEFDGWYSTTNGEITANDGKVTTVTPITRDLVLKAVFKGFGKTHTTAEGLVYDNYTVLKGYNGDSSEITIPKATTRFESDFGNEKIKTINAYQTLFHLDIDVKTWGWSFDENVFTNLECINILNDTSSSSELVIADSAFKNLTSLKEIVYDSNLYISYIGFEAFNGCTSLTNIDNQSLISSGRAYIDAVDKSYSNTSLYLHCGAFENTGISKLWIYGTLIDTDHTIGVALFDSTQLVEIRYNGDDLDKNEGDKFVGLPKVDGKHWEDEDGNTITQFSEAGIYTLVQD